MIDISGSVIERLGRAIMAQLSVITGDRSEGLAVVKLADGQTTPVVLSPNTYAIPIAISNSGARADEQMPVKVVHNPATVKEHLQVGNWTIVPGNGVQVRFRSNLGGARGNWKPGTQLKFNPEIPGLNPMALVVGSGFTGGTIGPVKQVVSYDDFPSSDISKATFQGRVQDMPALVLAWMSSSPVEGRVAGLTQGATRKGRGVRAYFENFALYTLCGDATSGETRRKIALEVTEAARSLLGDHKINIDGERLSGLGTGLEITTSNRLPKKEQALPMLTTLRVISVRKRVDARTYQEWNKTRYKAFQEATDDNVQDLVRDDFTDPMP